ncbi:sugar ABC transporter permease [Paenibacillus alkaliterrae]|uniref:carbohydrate ABC transporter permease n=1 Tax=Paenibacillus alkaliterrae TaxID=320909 RepID=UPI001F423E5B|nr:sugar ABC transporter permease [Paenibacillus alkaliterrae]MCF2939475.1 sugar ABC transporter permease [Paenibacillus alkaliterrae]
MAIRWNRLLPYLMIFPNVAIYFVFIFIPVLWAIYLSFTNYTILSPGQWVGLANFESLLKDGIFHKAFWNTMIFWVLKVMPTMMIGLIVATLLNAKIRGVAWFRGAIYLPGVLSSVAVSMAWLWLLDPRSGPVNAIVKLLGIPPQNWLQDLALAMPAVIVISIWTNIGFAMIIYLAGLQGIPSHLYEAASIDGATGLKKFIYITVPMLKPITFFLFITLTIRSFQVFDIVYILTGGGPLNSTTTIVNQIVKTAFEEYKMGYASAQAIVLLLLTIIVTIVNYRVGSKRTMD